MSCGETRFVTTIICEMLWRVHHFWSLCDLMDTHIYTQCENGLHSSPSSSFSHFPHCPVAIWDTIKVAHSHIVFLQRSCVSTLSREPSGDVNSRRTSLSSFFPLSFLIIVLFFFWTPLVNSWLLKWLKVGCPFSLELENRLLSRFEAASQRRELSTMAECAKILSQVSVTAVLLCLNYSI